MNEQETATLPLADEAFQASYVAQLDTRVKRSDIVGSVSLEKRSAALFYDAVDGKFTLLEKAVDQEAATLLDALPREQWGRTVLVFGHATSSGGFVASGHGSLTGPQFFIKLMSGVHYRFDVDPTLAHLQPLFVEPVPKKPARHLRANGRKKNANAPANAPANASADGTTTRPAVKATSAGREVRARDTEENEDFSPEDLRRLRGEAPMTSKKRRY